MADLHNALRRGGLSRALKQALGDSRSEGGLERYGETIQPIVDLWTLPEWSFLRQERLWARRTSIAAVAAETSVLAVTNPANSTNLVIVEAVTVKAVTTAMPVFLELLDRASIAATLTLFNPAVVRDTRFSPASAGTGVPVETWQGTDTNVTSLNDILEEVFASTTEHLRYVSTPYVLRPGMGLLVQGNTINTGLVANWAGRVRTALPGEL